MWDFICGVAVGAFNIVTGALAAVGNLFLQGVQSMNATPSKIVKANSANRKAKLIRDDEKVIGLQSPNLIHTSSPGTLTTTTFDTTTYQDRAIIKLTNSTGSSTVCTGIAIQGKLVVEHAGAQGFIWEYSDYDSIDRNGEDFYELSNDFIISGDQAEHIGDYLWKELKPHSIYQLVLPGTQFQYDIGDVWHLEISYTINGMASEAELIDTDVEVIDISIRRNVADIGETLLSVRVPSGAWTKTLSRRAKLVTSGNSQRLYNRSNILTVASSTWTGQADYFCDGIDDDIEIQQAIDYLQLLGGGEILFTSGDFYISSKIIVYDNITINGRGFNTIIHATNLSQNILIDATLSSNTLIENFVLTGDNAIFVTPSLYCIMYFAGNLNTLYNVHIKDFKFNSASAYITGIYRGKTLVNNCRITNLVGINGNIKIYGIDSVYRVTNNYIDNIVGFGAFDGIGIRACHKCQQNSVSNCSTSKYGTGSDQSYADEGSTNPCADSAAGGYNS